MADKRRALPTFLAALTLLALAVAARPATASPAAAPSVSGSPAQDLEEIIEEYDKVASLITTDQARAASLGRAIKSLDKQVDRAQAGLQPIVRREFEIGPVTMLRVLLDGASAATLTDQHGMAEAYAHHTRAQIASLTAARKKNAAAKRSLDA